MPNATPAKRPEPVFITPSILDQFEVLPVSTTVSFVKHLGIPIGHVRYKETTGRWHYETNFSDAAVGSESTKAQGISSLVSTYATWAQIDDIENPADKRARIVKRMSDTAIGQPGKR